MSKKICLFIISCLLFFTILVNVNAATEDINTIFIGDSYCTANNYNNNGGEYHEEHGWAQKTAEKLNLKKYFISCRSGTGFIEPEGPDTFFTLLRKAYQSSSVKSDEVNLVVVAGGWNDHKAIENTDEGQIELTNKIKDFIDETKSLFPNAKIIISVIDWKIGNDADLIAILDELQNRIEPAYEKAASEKGIIYLSNGKKAIKDKPELFSNDNLHPNEKGQEAIAEMMSTFIKNKIQVESKNSSSDGKNVDKSSIFNGLELDNEYMTCEEMLGKKTGAKIVKSSITIIQVLSAIVAVINGMIILLPAVTKGDADALKASSKKLVWMGIVLLLILVFRPIVRLIGTIFEFDTTCIL